MRPLLTALVAVALTLPATVEAQTRQGLSVIGSMHHGYQVAPGERIEGSVVLRNTTDETLDVRVYLQDVVQLAGDDRYSPPGSHPRSLGPWVAVGQSLASIGPGQTETIPYTIAVPDTLDPGTSWGALVVEQDRIVMQRVEMAAQADQPARSITLNQRFRHAVVLTATRDGATGEVALADVSLVAGVDHVLLRVLVENPGGTLSRARIWLDLFDAGGAKTATLHGADLVILPSGVASGKIPIAGVPPGTYQGVLFVEGPAGVLGRRLQVDL